MPKKQGTKRKAMAPRQTFEVVAEVHGEASAEEELPPVQEVDADPPCGVLHDEESSISSPSDEGEKTKKKNSYAWRTVDKEMLAAFFQEYPMFYDVYLDEFKNVTAKREVVKQFVKEKFEDKGRPAPTYKQVIGFLKNYRTRFVKLHSKRSGQADEQLSATEQWVMKNFAYLRSHIKKRRGKVTHQFPSSKDSLNPESQTSSIASYSDEEDSILSIPSSSTVPGPKGVLDKGASTSRRTDTVRGRSSQDPAIINDNTDKQLSKILARADQAMQHTLGQNVSLSSHEVEVKSFAQYLTTLMTKIPEGQKWVNYSQQVLALTLDFSSRRCLQQQQQSQQQHYFDKSQQHQPQYNQQEEQQLDPQQQQQQYPEQQQQVSQRQPVALQSEHDTTNTTATLTSLTTVSAGFNSSQGSLLNFLESPPTSQTSAPTTTT